MGQLNFTNLDNVSVVLASVLAGVTSYSVQEVFNLGVADNYDRATIGEIGFHGTQPVQVNKVGSKTITISVGIGSQDELMMRNISNVSPLDFAITITDKSSPNFSSVYNCYNCLIQKNPTKTWAKGTMTLEYEIFSENVVVVDSPNSPLVTALSIANQI